MPLLASKNRKTVGDDVKVPDAGRPKSVKGICYADACERYSQGVFVFNNDQETARIVTTTIASSLSPFQPPMSLNEDIRIFNTAIHGIVEAVRDYIITEDEGNAIIQMISRSLANRRIDAAFTHLAAADKSLAVSGMRTSVGINHAG